MSWLSAFKKVGGTLLDVTTHTGGALGELAKNPIAKTIAIGAVKSINPVAGVLLSTLIQGINNVQEVMPEPESNELKKRIVMARVKKQAEQLGETIDDEQLDILTEGVLKALQAAANKTGKV